MSEVKTPWKDYMGDVPMHLDYFQGSMFDAVERMADMYPNSIAFDFMGRSVTYHKMVQEIEKCAKSLKTLGVRPGDKVTIAMPNCPQAIYMFYAVNLVGGIANMIHPLSAEKEIEFYLNASESTTAITLDQFYNKFEHIRQNTGIINIIIASVKDELSRTIRAGYMLTEGRKIQKIPEDAPVIRWKEFMDMSRYCFYKNYRVERGFNDPAVILYSGGTTGTTKGIVLTNGNFNALGQQIIAPTPCSVPATRCSPPCRCSTASASVCASTPCSRRAGAASSCRASPPRATPSRSSSTAATSSPAFPRCTRRCCACPAWTRPISAA